MKKVLHLPLLAAALLLGACSTINSRINEKSDIYYSLDEATRAKLDQGNIDLGFTPDMVYIALGQPDSKRQRVTADGTTDVWVYSTYYDRYEGNAHMGYRRWVVPTPHGYRVVYEPVHAPVYSQQREDNIRVTFQNGQVSSIETARG
jgi:hypothetical protein